MRYGFSPALFRAVLACAFGFMFAAAAQVTSDPAKADHLYQEGKDLLAAGDAIHALQKLVDSAQSGSADAENEVGKLYLAGNGVDQSSNEALYWFDRSAQHGNIRGMTNAGLMYFGGRGVNADFDKAALWLGKAAEQDQPLAQCVLGVLYLNGQGVPQDAAKAFELQTKSAAQGNADAYSELGKMYLLGQGVKQDNNAALEWFQKSADAGNAHGMTNLAVMYTGKYGTPKDMDKAVQWFTKGAEQDDPTAQYQLALLYDDGNGVQESSSKAFELFTKAAQQGVGLAQVAVGDYYLDGDDGLGIAIDIETAVGWYKAAIQSHDPQVLAEVAGRLLDPFSDIFDSDAARPLLLESVAAGNALGQYELAEEYLLDEDIADALEQYKASAAQGFGPACADLADLYFEGKDVERSPFDAYVWAALAIDRELSSLSSTRDKAAKELTPAQLEEANAVIAQKKSAWATK